ncbi:MAG: hypothetical protein O7G85_14170 [Planctomycetota bacterium]|nr:hypothetical protein [Planctomycetota bacterium]
MDQNLLFSLIIGSSGVVLAILGLILALTGKFAASRVARDIEELQQIKTQEKSALWMKDQELADSLKLRQGMLDGAQKVKDQLSTILYAKHGNLKKEAAYKMVSDAGRVFSALCDSHLAKFNPDEKTALLRAKDAAVEATYQTRSFLDEIKDPADLSSVQRSDLSRVRLELSEAQLVLRDHIQQQLIKRVLAENAQ